MVQSFHFWKGKISLVKMTLYSERGLCLYEVQSHPQEVIFWIYEWSLLDSRSVLHPYPPPTATWCCFPGTEARSSEYQERVNASPELWKKLDFVREVWQCEKLCNQFHFLINKWSTGESWPVSLGTRLKASFKEPVCLCLSPRGQTAHWTGSSQAPRISDGAGEPGLHQHAVPQERTLS